MLRSALVCDSCVGTTAYSSEDRVAGAPRSEIASATTGGPEAGTNGSRHALTRKSAVALLAVAKHGRRATLRFSLGFLVAATLRRPIRSPSPRSGPGRRGPPRHAGLCALGSVERDAAGRQCV